LLSFHFFFNAKFFRLYSLKVTLCEDGREFITFNFGQSSAPPDPFAKIAEDLNRWVPHRWLRRSEPSEPKSGPSGRNFRQFWRSTKKCFSSCFRIKQWTTFVNSFSCYSQNLYSILFISFLCTFMLYTLMLFTFISLTFILLLYCKIYCISFCN